MRNRTVAFAILLKGFSSVIAQTLLIRELLIVFYGNELTFGIMLCLWLIAGAVGSGLVADFFKKIDEARRPYALFQCLLSLWLPLAIVFIRTSKSLFGIPFGEVLPLTSIFFVAALSLSFFSMADGALFTLGFRLVGSVAKLYFFESLGIIAGGIAFTFILLSFFNSFQIALLVSGLNGLCCLLLLRKDTNLWLRQATRLFFLSAAASFFLAPLWQKMTLRQQWHGKDIVAYENSVYGNVAVAKEPGQFTIYYDGLPVVSIPSPETYFTEDFVHIPLLARSRTEKVLFAGTAAGGLLAEALKYPMQKIIYVEMDPVFIKILRSLKDPTIEDELRDPRVRIETTDARNFIRKTREKFDVVFVNAGLPTSLSLNRYYTKEFFKEIRTVLKKDGFAVFKTWGSLAYLSEELKKINASLLKTLKSEFSFCDVVPGDGFNIFIASGEKPNIDSETEISRWTSLNLKTYLINPSYLKLRLDKTYKNWFFSNIKDETAKAALNQDLKPTGLYDGLSLYYSQFSKKIPKVFSGTRKVRPRALALLLLLFFILWRLAGMPAKNKTLSLKITALTTGFYAMSVQVLVLFLFQSLLGYLFYWLAILTTSFMAGASLGALYAGKNIKTLSSFGNLGRLEAVLPLVTTVLVLITIRVGTPALFSLISISAGLLTGLQLPVIYELWITNLRRPTKTPASVAGRLYCLDLTGACLGALLMPIVLIPSCGIVASALMLCLVKLGNGWNVLAAED